MRISPWRGPGRLRLVALGAVGAAVFFPTSAWAFDAEVSSSTAAQAYSLRSPFDPILYRRRLTQTLGLGVYDLLSSEKAGSPQLFVKLRLRFDTDVGIDPNETSFTRTDPTNRFVPGLRESPLDLMYGYVEGTNFAGGWLGFRAGRQLTSNALGWWAFDGGLVRLTAPYVHAEVYGGFEQRGGWPLSSGRYERSGVRGGDRQDIPSDVFPTYQDAKLAPAMGFALESAGPTWIHGRLDYRKVWNRGAVLTSPFVDKVTGVLPQTSGARTPSERVGYATDVTAGKLGAGKGQIVYDVYDGFVSAYGVGLDAFVPQKITAGVDWDYYRPTFDGDSIFNWITHNRMKTGTGRVAASITPEIDVAASGGERIWQIYVESPLTTLGPVGSGHPELAARPRPHPWLPCPHGDPRRSQDPRGASPSWPQAPERLDRRQMRSEGFPASLRVKKRREFLRIQGAGGKHHLRHFLVFVVPPASRPLEEGVRPTRLGVTVTRKVGCAVVRNRI